MDVESRSAASWSARLAVLKSRGATDTDPRIIECREALAYWRVRRSIAKERGKLSRAGATRLRAALAEAVA